MQADKEGFLYPDIDDSLCVHCDICRKGCPSQHDKFINAGPLGFWGGILRDEELLLKSSSGGAFTGVCKAMASDAIICGATYDDHLKVHHAWSLNDEGIDCFRKSKYLQSDVRDIYPSIKNFLADGKKVLFSGTACQVAGLYSYLKGKPENLYTVDLICHGVPSQKVFDAYIESLERHKHTCVTKFSFRDKSYFWGDWEIGTAFGNDRRCKHQAWGQDFYMSGFLRGLFYRPACYQCKYANAGMRRPADLTIGDFWGSKRINPEYDDKKGSSLIVVNSPKGMELIRQMHATMELTQVDREQAVAENHNLIEPTKENPKREEFFARLLEDQDFMDLMSKFRKGKSHSQKVRVFVTKFAPWLVERKRKKVCRERKGESI